MAKKPDRDPTEPGHSEDAPGKNKPRAGHELPESAVDNTLPGGSAGNTKVEPVNPDDLQTEQEKVAAGEDPKKPYPTGNPPTAEDERRRAAGLPREDQAAKPAKKTRE